MKLKASSNRILSVSNVLGTLLEHSMIVDGSAGKAPDAKLLSIDHDLDRERRLSA